MRERTISSLHKIGFYAAISAVFTAPLLLLVLNTYQTSSDLVFYSLCIKIFSSQFWQGDLYPRWIMEANSGFGSPVFIFNAPMAYWLSTPLAFLERHDLTGQLRLTIGIFLSMVASGAASYAWLRGRFDRATAFAGSVFYVAVPYKWIYIYLHHNLAQLWALVLLPLMMLTADRMLRGKRMAALWYAIFLALLVYTHPLSVVAFAVLPPVYTLVMCVKGKRLQLSAWLLLSHLAAAFFSLPYILPLISNIDFVQVAGFLAEKFDYASNFYHVDTFLNVHFAVLAVLALGLRKHKPDLFAKHERKLIYGGATAIFLLAFLTLPASKPIWEQVRILQYLQFPAARLHAPALIVSTLLFCIVWEKSKLAQWTDRFSRHFYSRRAVMLLMLVMTLLTLRQVGEVYYDHKIYAGDRHKSPVYAQRWIERPEYRPIWANYLLSDREQVARFAGLQYQLSILNGSAGVSLTDWDFRRIRFKANVMTDNALFQIKQLYFPTWVATTDKGENIPLFRSEDGLLRLALPKGDHIVTLRQNWLRVLQDRLQARNAQKPSTEKR